MRAPCRLCSCMSVYLSRHQLLNDWANPYEISYVYHDTWVHLNGIFHKSLPSVYVFVYAFPYAARQWLVKNVTEATNTHATIEELLEESSSIRSMSCQIKADD
jgi:hypothetical protein